LTVKVRSLLFGSYLVEQVYLFYFAAFVGESRMRFDVFGSKMDDKNDVG
jgi:hypothetical protein